MQNSTIRAVAPANIAFIKYWGQRDPALIIPHNDSFSMNLSGCYTAVECEIYDNPEKQELWIKNYREQKFVRAKEAELKKISQFYEKLKKRLGTGQEFGFKIKSANSFPKKAGIASSASFFSALALVFASGFGVELSEKELSILARLSGSGSACRSVPDGFVRWYKGVDSESSYAHSIAPPEYWDICDIVLLATTAEKKTGSGEGHLGAPTSPLYPSRLAELPTRILRILEAFEDKDFTLFGTIIEEDTVSMHSVMMTQNPPLFYWSGKTVEIIKKIIALRNRGVEAYFTIDAGENVHAICESKNEKKVAAYFRKQPEVTDLILNRPAVGARLM